MEGLLPATGSAVQLVLEHLWGALLVISESLRHVSALPAFVWEILIYSVVLVRLVKSQHALRSVNVRGERCSAHDEVSGKGGENTGPMTEADDTIRPPGVEASPPMLQILCLSAINTDPSRSALQAAVHLRHLREEVRKSRPSTLSQGTDEKPISKASAKDGRQLEKKITNDLNENNHFPESIERLKQKLARWKQRVQEKEEEKERLEKSNPRRKQVLKDRLRQLKAMAERLLQTILSPELPGDRVDGGHPAGQQERDAQPGHQSSPPSAVDLNAVTEDADFSVSPQSPEEERQEIARQLWAEEHVNEELVERIRSLETEEASLLQENAGLESEIQQLKLQLQILPESHEDDLRQLQETLLEEERRCLEIEQKLPIVYRNMSSTCETRHLYKKMAEDTRREVERTASYTRRKILFHAARARESWKAAELTERKLEELRRENERSRQMLAAVESTAQPLPRGPFAPADPPAAPRGPDMGGLPRVTRTPSKEEGPALSAQGSGVTCRFDSGQGSWVPDPHNHAEHLRSFSLKQLISF